MANGLMLQEAALKVIRNFSIPVREPSYLLESFWSIPLTTTRARPVPGNSGWVDFLSITVPEQHNAVINRYILSAFEEASVTFRWIIDGVLINPDSFQMPGAIDRHVDRLSATPFPGRFRSTYIWAGDGSVVTIQANNANQVRKLTLAAIAGWYYPSLGLGSTRGPAQGVTDAVR